MSPSKVRANDVYRTSTTNDIVSIIKMIIFYCGIMVLFRLPATWTWKARHGTKIHEQWQSPKKRARVNNLMKWERGWRHKYTKQASSRSPI